MDDLREMVVDVRDDLSQLRDEVARQGKLIALLLGASPQEYAKLRAAHMAIAASYGNLAKTLDPRLLAGVGEHHEDVA